MLHTLGSHASALVMNHSFLSCDSRELKRSTFLGRGRQPQVNISHDRTVVLSVSQIFKLIISNGEKIRSNIDVVVCRQVKRENSSLAVAARVSKTLRA